MPNSRRRVRICFLAALLTTAHTPELCLNVAKVQPVIAEKISSLRRCLREFPLDPLSRNAREQLVMLLTAANRYEEALQEYRPMVGLRKPSSEPDLKLMELLLKTGNYSEILRLTAAAPRNGQDVLFDEQLFEIRVQAFLAQGRYREARQALDQWLGMHGKEGVANTRFAADVRNLQQARRSMGALERMQGASGKAMFTASVPDSLKRWSRRRDVPIVFFKLVPADPGSQTAGRQLETQTEQAFRALVDEANQGFEYLSAGAFSLAFQGSHTLYVKTSDLDFSGSSSSLLASRVYVHTIPPLYRLAGKAFVVLVDYRIQSDGEAAYMGDGLIHIASDKLQKTTLMHEVLHGMGATHQAWNALSSLGYVFDTEDRGLMTFEKGLLRYLGMEEKNRILLDWPRVAAVRLND